MDCCINGSESTMAKKYGSCSIAFYKSSGPDMENIFLKLITIVLSFCGMEAVAWLSHKYLMHGLLWRLHKDHHKKEFYGFFEHNDFFFLIFAIPGIAALIFGIRSGYNFLFWIGIGICLYGLMYFLVHDVFIHQRIKIFR